MAYSWFVADHLFEKYTVSIRIRRKSFFKPKNLTHKMNEKQLLHYEAPLFIVNFIEIEHPIAATSGAKVTIGSGSDPITPDVDDWNEQTGNQNSYL